jgi:hypothetical protein
MPPLPRGERISYGPSWSPVERAKSEKGYDTEATLWIDFPPAMDVWILRHAKAEDRAPSGRDADRALTPDGKRRADTVGRGASREIPLRKSGVAHVSWEPGTAGRLEALLPPKLLERLGKREDPEAKA